jgi:hypothetical protein
MKKEKEIGFQIKGIYKLNYTINKKPEELIVEVELKMVDGLLKPKQNIYEGFATVNGSIYTEENLKYCVNAKFAAQSIGKKIRNEIIKKCKDEKNVFKITIW